jgi:hypothetical protein
LYTYPGWGRQEFLTFVETPEFVASADDAGVSDEALRRVQDFICGSPNAGAPLGAGLYKLRVPLAGRGKRGGARIIYFFASRRRVIYLLYAFAKNDASTISRAGLAHLRRLAARLEDE